MAGAIYDVHTIEHTWTASVEAAGASITEGVIAPPGERILSAFGWLTYGGAGARPMFVFIKYEFGEMYNDPDSEGVWFKYIVESDVAALQSAPSGTIVLVCAKETNPA